MKAKKRRVRAVYKTKRISIPVPENFPEGHGQFPDPQEVWIWIDKVIAEAAAILAPRSAAILAVDVCEWGFRLRNRLDDIVTAIEFGRAVERLNVQLHPKTQLGLSKEAADEVNRLSGKKGGGPRKHSADDVRAFLQADAKHRAVHKLTRKFRGMSGRTARRRLAEFNGAGSKK